MSATQSTVDVARRTAWDELRQAAPAWTPDARRTVVVAPHPDDEVLGAAGIIALQAAAGRPVEVVAVTDGEAAYPTIPPSTLADFRRREQEAALAELGADQAIVRRLGLPDGGVADHERTLADDLEHLLRPDDLLVTPWFFDHHCDHEAVGRAAALAARSVGCARASSLYWAWQHTDPTAAAAATMRRLDLPPEMLVRRDAALACHATQITDMVAPPILSMADLVPMTWIAEYYLLDPSPGGGGLSASGANLPSPGASS